MNIEIEGKDAVNATEELLAIEGLVGTYQIDSEIDREVTLATIATIVGIVGGTLSIAERLYQWNQKYLQEPRGATIERVIFVSPNGRRLLLRDASIKQIQEILED